MLASARKDPLHLALSFSGRAAPRSLTLTPRPHVARRRRASTSVAADLGDYVVVINAKEVRVTGRKAEQKVYRHHTQFPGGLKEIPFERMMERAPERVRPCAAAPDAVYARQPRYDHTVASCVCAFHRCCFRP